MLTGEEALGALLAARVRPFSARVLQRRVEAEGGVLVEKRPWVDLPAGGYSFVELNQAAVVLPAIGAEVVVISFRVPQGSNGIIDRVANQFVGGGWTEGTGDLLWRIQADSLPVRGYERMIASVGSTSNPADLQKSPIRIYENQLIELVARNVAIVVAAQPLLGLLGGYFYPIEQEGESYWL